MPIGIGTAIAGGAAVLGAGATIVAGNKAAKAQKSAANQAADTQLQVAQENNQLSRDMYNQNAARLDPYSRMGLETGDEYTRLLLGDDVQTGINPTTGATTAPPATTGTGAGVPAGYTGPALGQIGTQGQMDAYMAYYLAHPDQDPGFSNISQFHGDPFADEKNATAVLSARNAYLAAHPTPTGALATYAPPPTTGTSALAGVR